MGQQNLQSQYTIIIQFVLENQENNKNLGIVSQYSQSSPELLFAWNWNIHGTKAPLSINS